MINLKKIEELKNTVKKYGTLSSGEISELILFAEDQLLDNFFPPFFSIGPFIIYPSLKYKVFENKGNLNIFSKSQIYKYILFEIRSGSYIAIDGSMNKNSWDI